MAVEPGGEDDPEALKREVVSLRARVAELQRAAARHEDVEGISLAEREELLRDAERVAHLGTWTWDVGTGRVTWSDEMYRILGLEPGAIRPSVEAFFAAVHSEDRARAQAAADQSLNEGVLPLVDCRVVRPDGTIRYTTASSSILFDAKGVVRRVVGSVLDRTEQLKTESELRHTLGQLEEAQRFAQLGSWRFDSQRGELEWSSEFRRIAGLPSDLTPSADLFIELFVPEDRARFRALYQRSLTSLEGGEMHGRLRRPDGQVRHVRMQGFVVQALDGSRELRGTMLDVTDQMRLREELAHAQKMEAVGRLSGGIAHDFNNLLTVITGNLELLMARVGSRPELDNSFRALDSATSLTRRLLAFGRKAQLSLKNVAPNDLVHSTMSLMQRLVGDEVRLEVDLAPDLPEVRVDALEIERALVNLVTNARDAMPGGGIVRISTRLDTESLAPFVELSVADQGPGIDEADRERIFEPFFTTRADSGGTGLGLATVLGTAEQHGGTVRVDAAPAGGSIFTIALPAALAREEALHRAEPPPLRDDTRPLQLLVIDDEPEIAEVTRRMLAMRGHHVRVASKPEDALRIWAEHSASVDLVICDVAMAETRGPQLIARLGEVGGPPRVLFITGYSEEAVHSALGHPVLAKPFTSQALWSAVSEAMGTPSAGPRR